MPDKSRTPVIVGAARTPIGKFLGALASLSAPELGAIAIREALKRSKVPAEDVQEVIMGHVIQGGTGQAPARQAALKAGLPATVSAVTVNKVCGSGLKAVMLASQAIKAGDAQVIVAGLDRLGREHHRLEAGSANLVDGDCGYGRGKPGLESCLARGRLARPALDDVSHDDFLDVFGRNLGPLERLADGDGTEFRSAQR